MLFGVKRFSVSQDTQLAKQTALRNWNECNVTKVNYELADEQSENLLLDLICTFNNGTHKLKRKGYI